MANLGTFKFVLLGAGTLLLAGCATGESGALAQDSITSPAETRACLLSAIARERPFGLSAPSHVTATQSAARIGLGLAVGFEVTPGPAGSHVVYEGAGEPPPRAIRRMVERCVTPP